MGRVRPGVSPNSAECRMQMRGEAGRRDGGSDDKGRWMRTGVDPGSAEGIPEPIGAYLGAYLEDKIVGPGPNTSRVALNAKGA